MRKNRINKMCELIESFSEHLITTAKVGNLTSDLAISYVNKVSLEEAIKEVKEFCTSSTLWPRNDYGDPVGEKAARQTPPGILFNRFSTYCRKYGYNDENNLFVLNEPVVEPKDSKRFENDQKVKEWCDSLKNTFTA